MITFYPPSPSKGSRRGSKTSSINSGTSTRSPKSPTRLAVNNTTTTANNTVTPVLESVTVEVQDPKKNLSTSSGFEPMNIPKTNKDDQSAPVWGSTSIHETPPSVLVATPMGITMFGFGCVLLPAEEKKQMLQREMIRNEGM
uniref:Uncharacterized protein n=1 Tax=Timema cristinae TaxID=61476 RepID=A0A7R9GPP9_TIMCR|nr:unnamed protein product [Timema cristinae]